jgi:hypothetical protein
MGRGFLRAALLGLIIVVAPFVAEAQPEGKVWRIGLFHVGLDHVPPSLQSLREGLKALGYVDGKNLRLDWRNLPDEVAANETARDFVRQRVDLIVAFESQTVRAAKAATAEIRPFTERSGSSEARCSPTARTFAPSARMPLSTSIESSRARRPRHSRSSRSRGSSS